MWSINGDILTISDFPPGVSISQTFIGSRGIRHTLTMDVTRQDDNTTLACVLITDESVKSAEALLQVQGK